MKVVILAGVLYCSGSFSQTATIPGKPSAGTTSSTRGVEVSVIAKGARGDGVTDDSAAFQAAVNAACGGGTVLVPEPSVKYRLANNINLCGNLNIKGVQSRIFFDYRAFAGALFNASNSLDSNITIDGLWIDGYRAAKGATNQHYALFFRGFKPRLSNITVRNCRITNLLDTNFPHSSDRATDAVYVQYADNVTLENNVVDHIAGYGLHLASVSNFKILKNAINETAYASIKLAADNHNGVVAYNTVTGTGADTPHTRAEGGSIDMPSTTSYANTPNTHVAVLYNDLSGKHDYGNAIRAGAAQYLTIVGNRIHDLSGDLRPIYIGLRDRVDQTGRGIHDVVVARNTLVANTAGGVGISVINDGAGNTSVPVAKNITIDGNYILYPDSSNYFYSCLYVSGTSSGIEAVQVKNNICEASGDGVGAAGA